MRDEKPHQKWKAIRNCTFAAEIGGQYCKKPHLCIKKKRKLEAIFASKKGDNEYNYQSLRTSSQTHMLCVIAVKILWAFEHLVAKI